MNRALVTQQSSASFDVLCSFPSTTFLEDFCRGTGHQRIGAIHTLCDDATYANNNIVSYAATGGESHGATDITFFPDAYIAICDVHTVCPEL